MEERSGSFLPELPYTNTVSYTHLDVYKRQVTYIAVTESGHQLHQKYDAQYFPMLAPYMDEISEEDAETMIRTIETFYQIMRKRRD